MKDVEQKTSSVDATIADFITLRDLLKGMSKFYGL